MMHSLSQIKLRTKNAIGIAREYDINIEFNQLRVLMMKTMNQKMESWVESIRKVKISNFHQSESCLIPCL